MAFDYEYSTLLNQISTNILTFGSNLLEVSMRSVLHF